MIRPFLFLFAGFLCLLPAVQSGMALFGGITLALLLGNPFLKEFRKITRYLLQASVIGLGAGMDLAVVGRVGLQGLGYTVAGIFLSFFLGFVLGKFFRTSKDTTILLSAGTAICGGSAIAAVAPAIQAKDEDTSLSLSVVFILNSIGLYLFPLLGHVFDLSQRQFGLWSALAIHDTSSVVGTTMQYGTEALKIGTAVKLARALWIAPVSFALGYWTQRQGSHETKSKTKPPWFILGFLVAAALVTWIPDLKPLGTHVEALARRTMVLTLFLIGTSLTRDSLKRVGLKPLLHGTLLWLMIASISLGAILGHWIE